MRTKFQYRRLPFKQQTFIPFRNSQVENYALQMRKKVIFKSMQRKRERQIKKKFPSQTMHKTS